MEKIKIVFVGESNVGKSTLLNAMVKPNRKQGDYEPPTVGVAFTAHIVKHNNKIISLDLWDTAGQEIYRSLAPIYFRGTMYCILVFDLSRCSTFKKITSWKTACSNANPSNDTIFILLGNKSDLNVKAVLEDDIKEYCSRQNIYTYIETSAYTNLNVNKVIEVILQNYSPVKSVPHLNLVSQVQDDSSQCSC